MPNFMASGELWGLWLYDSLDILDASGDPRRPGICHGYFEGFWAACHTTGSVGATIPKLCGFLLSYGSQGFELLLVGSFGLMGQGEPSSTWSHCWSRSLGAGEPVLSSSTVFWNYVNEALIISNRLLKKFPSVGNVGMCIAQGSALPVSPATRSGNYLRTGWQPPCNSQTLGCIGAVLQVFRAIACCSGQLQAMLWTRFSVLHIAGKQLAPLTLKWQLY